MGNLKLQLQVQDVEEANIPGNNQAQCLNITPRSLIAIEASYVDFSNIWRQKLIAKCLGALLDRFGAKIHMFFKHDIFGNETFLLIFKHFSHKRTFDL